MEVYGGPDFGEFRHWEPLDDERTRIASLTVLRTMLGGQAVPGLGPATSTTLPVATSDQRWKRMTLREFYAGVGELSSAGPERGREQVRGVFAALIASLGDRPLVELVRELHQEFAAADFLATIEEAPRVQSFLDQVCEHAGLASFEEAAIVSRATLAFLAARSIRTQQAEPHHLDE